MTRGERAAQRDATSPLPAVDRIRMSTWSLELVTATSSLLDGPDDEALFLLLGVPDGTFNACRRCSTPGSQGSGTQPAAMNEDLSVLAALGMARWTEPDDILVAPRTDAIHAAIGAGRAQLLLGGYPWISRPVGAREEALSRRQATCQFGVYFHQGQAPVRARVYDVFDEQLAAGRSAVAEIRLEHS